MPPWKISCFAKCSHPKILLTYMTYNEYQQHNNFVHCIFVSEKAKIEWI